MSRRLVACACVLALFGAGAGMAQGPSPARTADRVVLVTLDGVRIQEMFGGLDVDVLRSTLGDARRVEDTRSYARFWAPTPEERRRKLMPFLWSLVADQGSIAGDRSAASVVRLANRHWFSYPGYSELLVGEPQDDAITTNDPIRNPSRTVLEAIRQQLRLSPADVATFAGWGVFNQIVEHTEGSTVVNAGVEPLAAAGEDAQRLNTLQEEVAAPWDNVRYDAFTFRLAMDYLARHRPRVLYLALDETDDWAHDGRYEHALQALHRSDAYLRELWTWLQAQPEYRGRTSLLVTTDHGRGDTPETWRDHGAKVRGSDDVWIAFASPHLTRRGVWRNHAPLSTNQVAATLAAWMGVDWRRERPTAGAPIRD
jgi:hypothetical protein